MALMYTRLLDLPDLLGHRSVFLFGPRQTGKSTLVRATLPDAASYDLLEADTFRELSARPESLRQTLHPRKRVLVVDEIQKLPLLLDEIQLLLDRNRDLRVVLTGSSARKLKRGAANLLGGRAWVSRLHPLVSPEVGPGRLLERLERGGLPAVLDSAHPREDLKAYVGTYLREEIQAEGLTRSIHGFSRFLDVAGLMQPGTSRPVNPRRAPSGSARPPPMRAGSTSRRRCPGGDRAQVAVQPVERLAHDFGEGRDVAALEEHVLLVRLGRAEQAEERPLALVEREGEVVAPVLHQDRHAHAGGEVEGRHLGRASLQHPSAHEDERAEAALDRPHHGPVVGAHAEAVERESGAVDVGRLSR